MRSAKAHRENNLKYYHQRRQEFIQKLGGKCLMCGSTIDLELDHIDSTNKVFGISSHMQYAKEKVAEEVSKCQLLCKICHRKKTKNSIDAPCKISADMAIKICEEYNKGGITQKALGSKYGIAQNTISAIVRGTRWGEETEMVRKRFTNSPGSSPGGTATF